jgi:hypothetical protein
MKRRIFAGLGAIAVVAAVFVSWNTIAESQGSRHELLNNTNGQCTAIGVDGYKPYVTTFSC